MRLDEVSLGLRLERRTTNGSSSGRIMRLVLVFILETHNPDELPNHCPTSSRRMMRPQYKNGNDIIGNDVFSVSHTRILPTEVEPHLLDTSPTGGPSSKYEYWGTSALLRNIDFEI